MNRKKDPLRLGLLAIGALFLFNPTVNIIDPLPDFVGYMLIAIGLTAISYMSDALWAARKNFVYLSFLGGAKLVMSFAVMGSSGSFVVLVSFCFAVSEAILFISAASSLFEGLSSLGMRFGSDSVFSVVPSDSKMRRANALIKKAEGLDEKKKKSLYAEARKLQKGMSLNALKALTIFAFIIRCAGSFLPTLPYLMLYGDSLFVTSGQIDWSNYIVVFYILAVLAGLGAGIPWVVNFMLYFFGVAKDSAFSNAVYDKYEREILSDKGRLCADKMKKVMVILVAAAFLLAYVPIDYINAFPNFISAGLIIGAFAYLFTEAKVRSVFGIVTALISAAAAGVGTWLQFYYRGNNYDPAAAVAFGGEGRGMADEIYFVMEIFSYIEALFLLIAVLFLVSTFMKALNRHIAMMPPRRDGLERDAKAMKKCLIPVAVSGGIALVLNFGIVFVTKYFTGVWLLYLIAVGVLFVFTLLAYFKLSDNVYLPLRRKF